MTARSQAYRTWRQRLAAPTISHGSVIQLYNNIYPGSIGAQRNGKKSALTDDECVELMRTFRSRVAVDGGPRATPDKEELGRHWLNEHARRLGLPISAEHPYLAIETFHLVGLHEYDRFDDRWGLRVSAAPIWRAYWADGSFIGYAPTAWQGSLSSKLPKLWWEFGEAAAA